jgi:hypothetical protein
VTGKAPRGQRLRALLGSPTSAAVATADPAAEAGRLYWTERTPEEIRQRRRAEAIDARWRAILVTVFALLLGLGAYVWGEDWLQVPLIGLSALLGYMIQRAFTKKEEQDQLQQDVVALTAIYYQSPLTIRNMLLPAAIDRAIENLLNASLGDEEMGSAFWRQSVGPFLHNIGSGYKRDWRYQVDMIGLDAPLAFDLDGVQVQFSDAEYRALHTTVTYVQTVENPADVFYVAVVFDASSLPAWFKRENFWLRELTELPDDCLEVLAKRTPMPDHLPDDLAEIPDEARIEKVSDDVKGAAAKLLSTEVGVGEEVLRPQLLYLDGKGVAWGFVPSDEAKKSLRSGCEVHVELKTIVSKRLRYFPVNLNAPTHHPTIHFNYGRSDITGVTTEVFYSAQRPYDARLRTEYRDGHRVVVRTEPDDWVFRGSGCVFMWD